MQSADFYSKFSSEFQIQDSSGQDCQCRLSWAVAFSFYPYADPVRAALLQTRALRFGDRQYVQVSRVALCSRCLPRPGLPTWPRPFIVLDPRLLPSACGPDTKETILVSEKKISAIATSGDDLIKYFLFSQVYIDQIFTVAMGWAGRGMKINLCNLFFLCVKSISA